MTEFDEEISASVEYLRQAPRLAFEAQLDGQEISIDHYQMSSALTLTLLRDAVGVQRIPTTVWERAREDVERAAQFGVASAMSIEDDWLYLRLDEPPHLRLVEVRLDPDGLVIGETELPPAAGGISGDITVDGHIAFVLAMLRQHDGTLATSLTRFAFAAYDVQVGYAWRAITEADGEDTLIHLFQPVKPPHAERFPPTSGT